MADKRKVQEINAGSMANIAFLLLIFFLVATTMNVDTGLVRMLPPMPEDEHLQEEIKIKERNLFLVFVSGSGNIMAGGEMIELNALKDKAREFITNPLNDGNLPERIPYDIEMPDGSKWTYSISQGVISLQTTRETSYDVYIMVQNELTRAFNEVRNELSSQKFGRKFDDLPSEYKNIITKAIPLKISEAEPRQIQR